MKRPGATGFTLLEVAVALAILGVGVVTCFDIFGRSLKLQTRALRRVEAVNVARDAMDRLMLEEGPEDGEPPRYRQGDCPLALKEGAEAVGFQLSCTSERAVTPADEADDSESLNESIELRAIRVEVRWHEGAGEKTYALSTRATFPKPDDDT